MRVGAHSREYQPVVNSRPATSTVMNDIEKALAALEESRQKAEAYLKKIDEQAASLRRRREKGEGSDANPVTEVQAPPTCVTECKGDLFSPGNTLHLVHCVGGDFRMSSGIAAEFRVRFGGVDVLRNQKVQVGGVGELDREGRKIFYLVTKNYSTDKPTVESVKQSLCALLARCRELKITALSMPNIACGLDRLEWATVKQIIEDVFNTSSITIKVFSLDKPPQKTGRSRAINHAAEHSNNWLRKQYYKSRQVQTGSSANNRSRGEGSAGGRDSVGRSWQRDSKQEERRGRSRSGNNTHDRRGEGKRSREYSNERSGGSRRREVEVSRPTHREDKKVSKQGSGGQAKKGKGGGGSSSGGGKGGGGSSSSEGKGSGGAKSGDDGEVHYHIHVHK